MSWWKNNKKIVVIVLGILVFGMIGVWSANRGRVVRVARLVCLTQYDDMMSGLEATTPVWQLLTDSRDAYCDCFADGIEKNWKKYSLMGTEKMVAEIMNDGEELSIACIDVFADFVN